MKLNLLYEANRLTRHGHLTGTITHMAPEQLLTGYGAEITKLNRKIRAARASNSSDTKLLQKLKKLKEKANAAWQKEASREPEQPIHYKYSGTMTKDPETLIAGFLKTKNNPSSMETILGAIYPYLEKLESRGWDVPSKTDFEKAIERLEDRDLVKQTAINRYIWVG